MIFLLLIFKVIMTYRKVPIALSSPHQEFKLFESHSFDSERDGDIYRDRGDQELERVL